MFVDVTLMGVPLDVIEWSKRMVAWQKQHSLKAADADMAGIEAHERDVCIGSPPRAIVQRSAPAGITAVSRIDHRPGRFNVEVE